MSQDNELQALYRGRHLSIMARGGWEFAARNTARPAVGIVAITDSRHVVLVEQYRPPVGRTVIELPAGLAGDVPGAEDESLLAAAKRELLEETGYDAKRWTQLVCGYSSPGLTDESIVIYLAERLERQNAGGGDATENITIHEVPFDAISAWLRERHAEVDLKLFAGLFAAREHLQARGELT